MAGARWVLSAAWIVALGSAGIGVAGAEPLLSDPLAGATSGQQNGGELLPDGWKAPGQIHWDVGAAIVEGGLSVVLTNWDPNEDSPQHQFDKQHIVNLYEAAHGSPHASDGDTPMTSFWNIRTGAGYDNAFKFLSSTAGFAERQETRVKLPAGTIQPDQERTLRVEWTAGGTITAFLDGQPVVTHEHGKPFHLRHVFIGTDNAPAGTYGPQADVVYHDLQVWGVTEVPGGGGEPGGGEPAGGTGDPLVVTPVADTWIEPGAPTVSHGADPELRAGGDGRVIFLRFAVQGVGPVAAAELRLSALNGGGGGDLHRVADVGWDEATVTAAAAPSVDPAVLASVGPVAVGDVVPFDASAVVTGDGVYSFAIASTVEDGVGYHAREAPSGQPVLVLTPGEPAGGGGNTGDTGGADAGGTDAEGGPQDDSCGGRCGGVAPAGCHCDPGCLAAGTCCKDACAVCGECPTGGGGAGGGEGGGGGGAADVASGGGEGGGGGSPAGDAGTPGSGVDPDAGGTGGGGEGGSSPVGGGFSAGTVDTSAATPTDEGCQAERRGRSVPGWAAATALALAVWRRRARHCPFLPQSSSDAVQVG